MTRLQNAGTFLLNPLVRRRYLKWLACKYIAGRPPYVVLPKEHRVLPGPRFNDYHAIATQHPAEEEYALVHGLLASSESGVFIDVGANVGTMSVLAHSTGHSSRIIALEPNHRYCEAWRINMALNGIETAVLVEAAAGDVCGEVPFRTDPACPLNGKIDVGQIYPTSIISNVQMITIDALCETCGVENVGVLKIDTEGAEPIVIRGAKRMLKEKKIRYILMEFIVEFMEDMNEDPQS